jgi:hypothetical protein
MSAKVLDVVREAKETFNYNDMTDAEKIIFYEELLNALHLTFIKKDK